MPTTHERAEGLLLRAYDESPASVELAQWVSIAVSVEPHLLRRARLRLARHLDAGAESDRWFGPLVASRSASAIVLDRAVARVLRDNLANDRTALANGVLPLTAARLLVADEHRHLPEAIRSEEKIIYLALSGGDDEEIEEVLYGALRSMRQDEQSAAAVARWADRALLGLPDRARSLEPARELAARTITRLGPRTRLLRETDDIRLPQGSSWASASSTSPRVPIGVRLGTTTLQFVEPTHTLGAVIELPSTSQLVDVSWKTKSGADGGRAELASIGASVSLPSAYSSVAIRTADGLVFDLTSQNVSAPQAAATTEVERRFRVATVVAYDAPQLRLPLVPFTDQGRGPLRVRPLMLSDPRGERDVQVIWSADADFPPRFVARGADGIVARESSPDAQAFAAALGIPLESPFGQSEEATLARSASLAERLTWRDERSIDDRQTYQAILKLLPGVTPNLGVRVPYGDLPFAIPIHSGLDSNMSPERARDLAQRAVAIAEAEGRVWHVARDRGDESLVVSTSAVAEAWKALTARVPLPGWLGLPALASTEPAAMASTAFSTGDYDSPEVMQLVMAALVDEFVALGAVRRVQLADVELLHFPDAFTPVAEVHYDRGATSVVWAAEFPEPIGSAVYQEVIIRLAAAGVTPIAPGSELTQFGTGDGTAWIERTSATSIGLRMRRNIPTAAAEHVHALFGAAISELNLGATVSRIIEKNTEPAPSALPVRVFVSVAARDRSPELDRFVTMLTDTIRSTWRVEIEISVGDAPVIDRADIVTMTKFWSDRVADALGTAHFFVAIVTEAFAQSPYCRAELAAFDSRVQRRAAAQAARLIIPVLWDGSRGAQLPPPLATLTAFDPKTYGSEAPDGFRGELARNPDNAGRVVRGLAIQMAFGVGYRLPPESVRDVASFLESFQGRAQPTPEPTLGMDGVLTLLQGLSLAFHVRRLDGEVHDREQLQSLYEVRTEVDVADFWHVRYMAEYVFSGPISGYLIDGEPDPFAVDEHAARERLRRAVEHFRSEDERNHELESLLSTIARDGEESDVHTAESILGMSLRDVAEQITKRRLSSRPVIDKQFDELLDRISDPDIARAVRRATAPAPRWFQDDDTSLRKCDNLPEYVERLTTHWLKYAALATRRLGEQPIEVVAAPERMIAACMRRFSDMGITLRGRREPSPYSRPPNEPMIDWSIRADRYAELVSKLRELLLPALFDEGKRREQQRQQSLLA